MTISGPRSLSRCHHAMRTGCPFCANVPRRLGLSLTPSLGRSSSSALCCHSLRLLRRRTLPEGLFIYFENQHPTAQHQNYKVHNTVYPYMDTKGRASRKSPLT